jgi:hypothetical protein
MAATATPVHDRRSRLRAEGASASLAEALAEAGRSALLLLYHSIWDEMRLDGDEYLNY